VRQKHQELYNFKIYEKVEKAVFRSKLYFQDEKKI